jgi:hypothetical protein
MVSRGSGFMNSVSHYTIFKRPIGFRRIQHNDFVYEVEGLSGAIFVFDVNSGAISVDTSAISTGPGARVRVIP